MRRHQWISAIFAITLGLMLCNFACEETANTSNDTVWFYTPAGNQCEDPKFADLNAAIESIKAQNISVLSSREEYLTVCEACTVCPTSLHFFVEISNQFSNQIVEHGWLEYENDN